MWDISQVAVDFFIFFFAAEMKMGQSEEWCMRMEDGREAGGGRCVRR